MVGRGTALRLEGGGVLLRWRGGVIMLAAEARGVVMHGSARAARRDGRRPADDERHVIGYSLPRLVDAFFACREYFAGTGLVENG